MTLSYTAYLLKLQNTINKRIKKDAKDLLAKYDSLEGDLSEFSKFYEKYFNRILSIGVSKHGKRVWVQNDVRYLGTVFEVLGINDIPDSTYRGLLQFWTLENVSLIKNVSRGMVANIESALLQASRGSIRAVDLSKVIEKQFGYSRQRAKLIARDQVLKLSNAIDHVKQTSLGIERYTWRDSQDGRVRPTHKANGDKSFRWDTPPAKTGHPGHDVQCRCTADPDIDWLIKEAESVA